ncbi:MULTISPECIES: halocyanin domain-containing protein [Salinibaculum]|uniref:halocyanin domain-containing protein n=1 Tax=Salinibaculum TaxID=2732368 RepID=UPI0030CB3C88
MDQQRTRRQYLLGVGSLGIAALAGCSGGSAATPSGTPRPTLTADASFDGWLATTTNFDGSVVDARDQAETTVTVGALGNGGSRAYAPAAIAVDPGTTVVWEWTGNGGAHDVVSPGGAFRSEIYYEAGPHFEHTFESEGVYEYYCTPHQRVGMKGVVAVGSIE